MKQFLQTSVTRRCVWWLLVIVCAQVEIPRHAGSLIPSAWAQIVTNDSTIHLEGLSIKVNPKPGAAGAPSPSKDAQLKVRAEAGDPKAQNDVGIMYYVGEGLPQDFKQALLWFLERFNK